MVGSTAKQPKVRVESTGYREVLHRPEAKMPFPKHAGSGLVGGSGGGGDGCSGGGSGGGGMQGWSSTSGELASE